MSEIDRFTPDNSESMLAAVVWDSEGGWVRYKDHLADVERLISKRDAAQAEVERLTQELDGRRATNQRVMAERDMARAEVARLKDNLFPWDTYQRLKNANEHLKEDVATLTAERDAAQAEVERLRASGQAMLDTSRCSDEDIWRSAFMVQLMKSSSYQWERSSEEADLVLTTYRKRWPR